MYTSMGGPAPSRSPSWAPSMPTKAPLSPPGENSSMGTRAGLSSGRMAATALPTWAVLGLLPALVVLAPTAALMLWRSRRPPGQRRAWTHLRLLNALAAVAFTLTVAGELAVDAWRVAAIRPGGDVVVSSSPKVSPDGRYLAVTLRAPSEDERPRSLTRVAPNFEMMKRVHVGMNHRKSDITATKTTSQTLKSAKSTPSASSVPKSVMKHAARIIFPIAVSLRPPSIMTA